MNNKGTLGVIIGNRGCFPGSLAEKGRQEIAVALKKQGIEAVIIAKEEAKYGAIENLAEARKNAALFRENRDKIDGILVSLPNFGDERAIADTIRMSELNVPVLVQAYPDDLKKMAVEYRRDSFCGKLSTCNVLRQYGIPYSLTRTHTSAPDSREFKEDLDWFLAVCRVVKGLKGARIGAIGARTTPFKTVRYSEKLLEASGISVETLDLSEILTAVNKLKDNDPQVQSKLKILSGYCVTRDISAKSLLKMAKMGTALDRWVKENEIDACTIQCWSALQDALQIFPCALMSIMSEALLPAACEVDVMGAVAMYALQLASGKPAGLFDWNNNYGGDPDKLVLFHCSNAPKSMLGPVCMGYNKIAARMGAGPENSYGTCSGKIKSGPMTYVRFSSDDTSAEIIGCIGEGVITNDPLDTFGGVGVARIEKLQELLRFLCQNGFEHHVAISQSKSAGILFEALDNYVGWDVYLHQR
ncbi:MAG: L-fucose/L-arabinose isomerase family protein [Candidatus Omnitrophota bacterium]|nr:L-fucose/L-arabinose isomerase family protein [Candidatus Omnitrophota bacterium]